VAALLHTAMAPILSQPIRRFPIASGAYARSTYAQTPVLPSTNTIGKSSRQTRGCWGSPMVHHGVLSVPKRTFDQKIMYSSPSGDRGRELMLSIYHFSRLHSVFFGGIQRRLDVVPKPRLINSLGVLGVPGNPLIHTLMFLAPTGTL